MSGSPGSSSTGAVSTAPVCTPYRSMLLTGQHPQATGHLMKLQAQWGDWFDNQRRVIRNAYGPLSDPEGDPDWSLLS